MGIVNADYDYNLARKIGAYRWPSILGIVDEQVYTYGDNNIISKENLKKFVTQMLPADLITTVSNSCNSYTLLSTNEIRVHVVMNVKKKGSLNEPKSNHDRKNPFLIPYSVYARLYDFPCDGLGFVCNS